ncbi:MAG TPA: hypothetical protein EYH30_09550, partial [Anaerolineales bacterium]|nr:hypothetical protein [Anaerolineales bacterium]
PTNTPPPTYTPRPPQPPTYTPTPTAEAPPSVQAVTPNTQVNTAPAAITITGLNFKPGCSASLGTVPLTVTNCLSTEIAAWVPVDLAAGYYDLTVTNTDGRSGTLTGAYTATNPAPVVTSILPPLSEVNTDPLVTITGSDFCASGTPGSLQVSLDGTLLTNVTYVSPTLLTAVVPAGSQGMALGVYTLTVTNPGPTAPSGSLPDAFALYTYTTAVTCTAGGVSDCGNAGGPPDGMSASITSTGVITLDFGLGGGITDGPGYDMVFYEWPHPPGILLDYVIIDLSADGATWYTVFGWDGVAGGVDGTNIDSYATDGNGEQENEPIDANDLYPGPGGLSTGIAIDIGRWTPPGPSFHLIRFTYPSGGTDYGQVDAVLRLH